MEEVSLKRKNIVTFSPTEENRSKIESILETIISSGQLPPDSALPTGFHSFADHLIEYRNIILEREKKNFTEDELNNPIFYAVALRLCTDKEFTQHSDFTQTNIHRRFWANVLLRSSIDSIYTGELQESLALSKKVLSLTQDEDLRDEAMNLIGYIKMQEGELEEALKALSTALDDDLNENLIVNAAYIANLLDVSTALNFSAKLIMRAPTTKLQLLIAHTTLDRFKIEDDDIEEVPESLMDSLVGLLCSSDLNKDDFIKLLDVTLSVAQEDSFFEEDIADSRHCSEPAVEYFFRKKENGAIEVLSLLSSLDKKYPDELWIKEEKDFLITLTQILLGQGKPAGIILGLELLKADLTMDNFDRIEIVGFLIPRFIEMMKEGNGDKSDQISDYMISQILWACKMLPYIPEDKDELKELVKNAAEYTQKHLLQATAAGIEYLQVTYSGRAVDRRQLFMIQKEWYDTLIILRPYCSKETIKLTDELLTYINNI